MSDRNREVQWQRRRRTGNGIDSPVWWHDWHACTEAAAKRVSYLHSWDVRRIEPVVAASPQVAQPAQPDTLERVEKALAKSIDNFPANVEHTQALADLRALRQQAAPQEAEAPAPPLAPELPKRFAIIRLNQDGSPADIAQCAQDAAMWAYGTVDVYAESQLRQLLRETR